MNMDSQYNSYIDPHQQGKCPVCGGETFEWGRLAGQSYYLPGESLWRVSGRQVIKIRRCLQCNNLLSFTDPNLSRQQNVMIAIVLLIVFISLLLGFVLPIFFTVHR
jgi:hypothetical protein